MKIKKSSKAIGYLRTATTVEDKSNNSLCNQKKNILNWAKENDIKIEKFYSDVGSGFSRYRPLLHLMIDEIKEDVVTPDALIVSSFSRLSRNMKTETELKTLLDDKNIDIISVSELLPTSQDTSFSWKTFVNMLNESQSKINSQQVHSRLNENARKGYFTGGVIPYGYKSVPVNQNIRKKELIANTSESLVVEKIFKLAKSGIDGSPLGFQEISNHLNKKNSKYRGQRWNVRIVSSILKNTLYYGESVWGKTRCANHKDVAPIITKNQPIISKQVFLEVQEKLSQRTPRKGDN